MHLKPSGMLNVSLRTIDRYYTFDLPPYTGSLSGKEWFWHGDNGTTLDRGVASYRDGEGWNSEKEIERGKNWFMFGERYPDLEGKQQHDE